MPSLCSCWIICQHGFDGWTGAVRAGEVLADGSESEVPAALRCEQSKRDAMGSAVIARLE